MPLYVVATPIGNLQDLTARAREVLASCDGVVAEDTRYTGQLLKHLGIEKKPFHALPAYDEERRADAILERLEQGASLSCTGQWSKVSRSCRCPGRAPPSRR